MAVPGQHPKKTQDAAPEDAEFDRLVAGHQQRIYFFIRSMVFNPEDARDTLQDVNVILYRKRHTYKHGTNFKAWALAIARFECLSYLSRYKKMQWTTLDSAVLGQLADQAEQKADCILPWLVALRECIRLQPDDVQRLLESHYHRLTPLDTIASQLQTSVGAVKQKLFRTRKKLRSCVLSRIKRES